MNRPIKRTMVTGNLFSVRQFIKTLQRFGLALALLAGFGFNLRAAEKLTPIIGRTLPGVVAGVQAGRVFALSNDTIGLSWTLHDDKLQFTNIDNKLNGKSYPQEREIFSVSAGNAVISASACTLVGIPALNAIKPLSGSAKAADGFGGWRLSAEFTHPASGLAIRWSAELRNGSHYVRQVVTVEGKGGELTEVRMLDTAIGKADIVGTAVAGNPICSDDLFLGLELPMSQNVPGKDGTVVCSLSCKLPLVAGNPYDFSAVIGVYPEGQLRRAFLRYLERERAAAYNPFLHYNGWFDFDRAVNEKGMLETIEAYHQELMTKRGIPVRAFVIDDGWDNWKQGFWAVDATKFPNQFKATGSALDKIGSRFGIWISPLGGYDHSAERKDLAAKEGLIPPGKTELDLAYQPYYKWFLDTCTHLVRDDKVAYFKFDKAGNGVNPHFLALLNICRELRKVDPNLFINITVGTWPSPFWLNHIDCTWRGGNDMGYEGPGDERERWITYRDAQTWRGVVNWAPLYPLNSIMNHGICLSNGHFFPRQALTAGTNLRNEARSYFGSGTALQELYVKPSITPPETWDQIAEAAKWANANQDVLVDTHWVGGNPTNGKEIYGWASWSPRKGILTLRNPKDTEGVFPLDLAKVLELPKDALGSYTVTSAYADSPSPISEVESGKVVEIKLKPFEVLVLEMIKK